MGSNNNKNNVSEKVTDTGDAKSEQKAKLSNILSKIRQKNAQNEDNSGKVSITGGTSSKKGNIPPKYATLSIEEDVTGEKIKRERFENGHLLNMQNGRIVNDC